MLIDSTVDTSIEEQTANWGAVFAMSLCVFALVASEFLPVSLLTPLASDLMMSEGQAGQTISISGIFAVITSLYVAVITRKMDRRPVMLILTGIMILSGFVVTFAPNYFILMVGRALLGVVIGGFWSLSTATLIRLLPPEKLPKGLAILNGGNALAATIAAPVGSFLGAYLGWRGAFFTIVPIAVISLFWQMKTFPSMKPLKIENISFNVFRLLGRLEFSLGMTAILCLFMGQFALFTYLRPFLETVTGMVVSTLSFTLLILGISGFFGTMVVGKLLNKTLFPILIVWPFIMSLIGFGFVVFGSHELSTMFLIAVWGFIGTSACVGWYIWLAKVVPNDTEQGGGLMIAVIQLAITLGASIGGLIYDNNGYQATFIMGSVILLFAAILSLWAYHIRKSSQKQDKNI